MGEKTDDVPEKPAKKGRPKASEKATENALKVETILKTEEKLPPQVNKVSVVKPPVVVSETAKEEQKTCETKPKEETDTEMKIIEKIIEKAVSSPPPIAPAPVVVKPVKEKKAGGGRKRKNESALAPVTSNAKAAKVQKTASKAAGAAAKSSVVIPASIASIATSGGGPPLAAKIITGSPGSPAKIAITGNNLVSLSSLTQPLPPQVVLPTTPVAATQVQSVKSSAPPPHVIQLRPAGTAVCTSMGSATSGGMQIRPLRAAGVGGGGVGPRPQFFKIVGGKPVQISNLQRLPAGSAVGALQQAPAGSRVVYMRAPTPAGSTGSTGGAQAASVVVTSSGSATTTSSATTPVGTGPLPAVSSSGGSSAGNKIILLSNKGQAIPVSGKGGVSGGPSIVRIVSPNSLTTTSGGKLALAPNSPTKVLRPATGATGPILLRTVAPRPTSTAAPPIQLPMAPLPKSALTNNPTTAAVTVTSDGKAKIVSQNDTTAKAIQVLLPKSPLPPTNSNIVASSTAPAAVTAAPVSPQKSPGGGITTTTTTTTASGAFVWTNSTRANFKLSSRTNFASLDKFKNVVNKDVHFILASIVTEDKSNEFSFRLHLKREPIGGGAASKAKKAAATAGEPQQSYLELEGKAKVPTAQEWSLKVKTEPPVFLVSKGNFLADFPAVRIPKEIAEKPFVDYELHIDKCSPMQVATTASASGASAMGTSGGAASKIVTGSTGGGVLPAKRARKPKVQKEATG